MAVRMEWGVRTMLHMLRRRSIRLPFLLALVCIVGVWVASYFGMISISANLRERSGTAFAIEGLGGISKWPFPTQSPRFFFQRRATVSDLYLPHAPTLGFYYDTMSPMRGFFEVVFPLWLPTPLWAGLCWWVGRMTRVREIGRAFPVEPTESKSGLPGNVFDFDTSGGSSFS